MSSISKPASIRAPINSDCAKQNSKRRTATSMSSSDKSPAGRAQERAQEAANERANDAYGWIDRCAADLHRSAKELVAKGEAARVSDDAVRLYYAKSELEDRPVPAVVQEGQETLTPTEMLVAVSEMLRDVRLGPMELGL